MEKFAITITETDEGIKLAFVDYTIKKKADLDTLFEGSLVHALSKSLLQEVQRAHHLADILVPDKK